MKGINLKIISQAAQRYDTVGDWWVDDEDEWQIRVSGMSDWRYEFLVFIHEITEMAWCVWRGIKEEDVSAFDTAYTGEGEPGNDLSAPYWFGHQMATVIEKIASNILHVSWEEYDKEVTNL